MATIGTGMDVDGKSTSINCDDGLSFKDFTNKDCRNLSFSGKTIYMSCFCQEVPDSAILPEDTTGATFYNCNMDNVVIPAGNTLIGGTNKRYEAQNDLRDWEIDILGIPIKVLNEEYWTELGFSVDPLDIPLEPYDDLSEIKPSGVK